MEEIDYRLVETPEELAAACGRLARALFPDYPGHVPAGTFTSPLGTGATTAG